VSASDSDAVDVSGGVSARGGRDCVVVGEWGCKSLASPRLELCECRMIWWLMRPVTPVVRPPTSSHERSMPSASRLLAAMPASETGSTLWELMSDRMPALARKSTASRKMRSSRSAWRCEWSRCADRDARSDVRANWVPAAPMRVAGQPMCAWGMRNPSVKINTSNRDGSLLLDPNDRVETAQTGTGQTLSLDGGATGLTIIPDTTTSGTRTRPSGDSGQGGILALDTDNGTDAVTLDGGGGDVGALWRGTGGDVNLTTTTDAHVQGAFNPATGAITLAPVAGASEPTRDTLSLIDPIAGDTVEREFTVTGALAGAVKASFNASGTSATLTSAAGGNFDLSLSTVGTGVAKQSTYLGDLHLDARQSIMITPADWTNLMSAPSEKFSTPVSTAPADSSSTTTGLAATGEPANRQLLLAGLLLLLVGGAICRTGRRIPTHNKGR
jgi:hypothetical protein